MRDDLSDNTPVHQSQFMHSNVKSSHKPQFLKMHLHKRNHERLLEDEPGSSQAKNQQTKKPASPVHIQNFDAISCLLYATNCDMVRWPRNSLLVLRDHPSKREEHRLLKLFHPM